MATVLLGWEFGGGLGHVASLLKVARPLAARGHAPVLVLKDIIGPLPVLKDVPFPVFQAPSWPGDAGPGFLARSFADILANRGYADADGLEALVGGWRRLIDLTGAKLVVADAAPTLMLAASGTVPVVTVENGFHAPPAEGEAFPVLCEGAKPFAPADVLLGVMREVQRRRGGPLPETLPAFLAGAHRFLRTFPELDTYRAARRDPADGPLVRHPAPASPPSRPSAFAYLAAEYPGVGLLLPALAKAGVRVGTFLRDAPPALVAACRGAGVTVHESPTPLPEACEGASVVIHHGSLGAAEAALAAGRPQLLLPRHVEHEMTGRALEGLGVGISLSGRLELGDVERAVGRLLDDPSFGTRAMALAREIRAREPGECLSRITDCCLRLLG